MAAIANTAVVDDHQAQIFGALSVLQEHQATLDQVAFAFHCWMPFHNLGPDGYQIKAIMYPEIPRMTLLPIPSVTAQHYDTVLNDQTNKFNTIVSNYQRPIRHSWAAMEYRFASFGMVRIPSLDCALDKAQRINEIFNRMMSGFGDGFLQDLPEYFGGMSPQQSQLEKMGKRLNTTAHLQLDALLRGGIVDRDEYDNFVLAIAQLAKSAALAHDKAIDPAEGIGILPASIRAINRGEKQGFDQVDTFLAGQFPDFNIDTRISTRAGNSGLDRLTSVLEEVLTRVSSRDADTIRKEVDAVKGPVILEDPPLMSEELQGEQEPPLDMSFGEEEEAAADGAFGELAKTDELPIMEKASGQCQALTAKNEQCKSPAREGFTTCVNVAHQKQMETPKEAVAAS